MPLQLLLVGGPLDGTIHELNPIFGMPAKIALLDDDGRRHWYIVDGDSAVFDYSEDSHA